MHPAHGHGFSGISRARLIRILQTRAEALGITIRGGVEFAACPPASDCDLVVGADGIHSTVRGLQAGGIRADHPRIQQPLSLARIDAPLRRLHLRLS